MEQNTIVRGFKSHLERLGYSNSTIQMLPNCVQDHLNFTGKSAFEIASSDILNYYEHLQERPNYCRSGGLSENYINHHVYALKLFFQWLIATNVLVECPMSGLQFPSPNTPERITLTQEEIKQLYEQTESYKERAVLGLYYGCGLRRSEGENLDLKDVHFRSNLLYVREGKNGKRRVIPLSESVKEDLYNYVTKERFTTKTTSFLVNQRHTRASGNIHNKTFKAILDRTEITKELSLHNLRHSIATHLLERGLSIEYVRSFLGHRHLESTQIYTHVQTSQLQGLWSH